MADKAIFRELIVWQKAIVLCKTVYRTTARMPPDERFGLTNQMRRAAVSVPSNIAEGNARLSTREYIQFLSIARGSLAELETQLILATEMQMIASADAALEQLREVRRMLQALMKSLAQRRVS